MKFIKPPNDAAICQECKNADFSRSYVMSLDNIILLYCLLKRILIKNEDYSNCLFIHWSLYSEWIEIIIYSLVICMDHLWHLLSTVDDLTGVFKTIIHQSFHQIGTCVISVWSVMIKIYLSTTPPGDRN